MAMNLLFNNAVGGTMELLQTYAFVVKVGADTGVGLDDENTVGQGSVAMGDGFAGGVRMKERW